MFPLQWLWFPSSTAEELPRNLRLATLPVQLDTKSQIRGTLGTLNGSGSEEFLPFRSSWTPSNLMAKHGMTEGPSVKIKGTRRNSAQSHSGHVTKQVKGDFCRRGKEKLMFVYSPKKVASWRGDKKNKKRKSGNWRIANLMSTSHN